MKEISDLPAEKMMEVFKYLPLSVLKDAVLVSRRWKNVGDYPALWKWCKVTVYSKEDINNLGWNKFKEIQEIRINPQNWNVEDWEAFFLATMDLLSLKNIDGLGDEDGRWYEVLGTVEKSVFAKALVKLEEVDLCNAGYDQIEELFTQMSQKTRIKKLSLPQHDLSPMDPGLFARVLSRLEDGCLFLNLATNEQIQSLFTQILEQNCLKRLELRETWTCSHLDPTLFARALSSIEEVTLEDCSLGRMDDQFVALFTELTYGTRVKKLEIGGFDLSEVEPTLFAMALSGLETLSLVDECEVTRDQMQELLTQISLKDQMKKLKIPDIDLYQLEPGLLAGVLAKMEDVDLSLCRYRVMPQLTDALFTEASRSTRLRTLVLCDVNLSSLDPNALAQSLSRLEELTLRGSKAILTEDQYQSFFTQVSLNTQLKKLDISNYNFRSLLSNMNLSSVNPQVLARALNRLEEVTLATVGLTHDQAEAFFSEMALNTNIKKLHFSNDPKLVAETADWGETTLALPFGEYKESGYLSALEAKALGTALTKLKEVSLCGTGLSLEKIVTILTSVLEEGSKLRKLEWGDDRGLEGLTTEILDKVESKLKGELKIN